MAKQSTGKRGAWQYPVMDAVVGGEGFPFPSTHCATRGGDNVWHVPRSTWVASMMLDCETRSPNEISDPGVEGSGAAHSKWVYQPH
jgi:hypothetical protein